MALGFVFTAQDDLPGDVGQVQGFGVGEPALAVGQGEQCGDEALLLIAYVYELFAGCEQRLYGGFGVGDRDLEQGRPGGLSGVRSSYREALAMKCRWESNDASRRANRSSSVSPSSVNSSLRPPRPSRRCRLLAEMSLAVVMMERGGRTNRPAISQPSARDNTAMIATAAAAARNASEPMKDL